MCVTDSASIRPRCITHLEEEDEDEDEDHAANAGENIDDMNQYEERIEQGDFENDVDEHEVHIRWHSKAKSKRR